jgi:multicomponent Na+:H+ antiporter subunit D
MTGKSKFSELGGLSHSMKLTTFCGIVGALAISAFPVTTGFIGKSMIVDSVFRDSFRWVWFLVLMASAGVFIHTGLRFSWFTFFQKDSGLRPTDPPLNMQLAMALCTILCFIPAIPTFPELSIYRLLPEMPDYQVYTAEHVVSQMQILLFSAAAFFIAVPFLRSSATITLDIDWFYRAFGKYILVVISVLGSFPIRIGAIVARKLIKKGIRATRYIHHPQGVLARNWSLGTTLTWVAVMLCVYMLVYYL